MLITKIEMVTKQLDLIIDVYNRLLITKIEMVTKHVAALPILDNSLLITKIEMVTKPQIDYIIYLISLQFKEEFLPF